jgi:hypothetical protein
VPQAERRAFSGAGYLDQAFLVLIIGIIWGQFRITSVVIRNCSQGHSDHKSFNAPIKNKDTGSIIKKQSEG